MTVVEHEIKLLVETCGRCGGLVVGDNLGNGRPWQHVDRADDHHVVFGTPAPPGHLSEAPSALDALEALLTEDEDAMPGPGVDRPAHDGELGDNRSGTRQMINTALKAGFTVDATVAVGPSKIGEHHDPRGYRLVERLLVGFKHTDGRAAVAVWERLYETESSKFAYVLGFAKGSTGGIQSSPALKAYLKV
jgi:hypothetical protein